MDKGMKIHSSFWNWQTPSRSESIVPVGERNEVKAQLAWLNGEASTYEPESYSSIPRRGTCPGCGVNLQCVACRRQLIDGSLHH